MKIAIVGTGVSGLVAAHRLRLDHEVVVFEADSRVGGHANTVDVTIDGVSHAVDTGFIVYNEQNYPAFSSLLSELGVASQPTTMSFSVVDRRCGLEYRSSNLNTLFAQRRNLCQPSFIRLLTEIARFNRTARLLVSSDQPHRTADRSPEPAASGTRGREDESLAEFVERHHFSDAFVSQYLVPFGASIWSADPQTFTQFPARAYARFMDNHGLLSLRDQPVWRTITGGSRRYVDALAASFSNQVRLSNPVHKVASSSPSGGTPGIEIAHSQGAERFDRVLLATHSDDALRILADPSAAEQSILGAISYQRNTVTLHTDERMLPVTLRARASWNYIVDEPSGHATVTYWMNELQGLRATKPILVTLNGADLIDPRSVKAEFEYSHPVFDAPAMAAQRARHEIQGQRGIYFAGAYWGYGFHEDGVQSGIAAADAIGRRT